MSYTLESPVFDMRLATVSNLDIYEATPVMDIGWLDHVGASSITIPDPGTYIIRGGRTIRRFFIMDGANVYISNFLFENTDVNAVDALVGDGNIRLENCRVRCPNAGTDGATNGIMAPGSGLQLRNCIIETAKNGTGTAYSITAASAVTVKTMGVYATHAAHGNITASPDAIVVDADLRA